MPPASATSASSGTASTSMTLMTPPLQTAFAVDAMYFFLVSGAFPRRAVSVGEHIHYICLLLMT